jgi:hypothetical protein
MHPNDQPRWPEEPCKFAIIDGKRVIVDGKRHDGIYER